MATEAPTPAPTTAKPSVASRGRDGRMMGSSSMTTPMGKSRAMGMSSRNLLVEASSAAAGPQHATIRGADPF